MLHDEDRALPRREGEERVRDPPPDVAREKVALRRRAVRRVERGRDLGSVVVVVGVAELGERHDGAAAADVVADRVDRDPREPRLEGGLSLEVAAVPGRP